MAWSWFAQKKNTSVLDRSEEVIILDDSHNCFHLWKCPKCDTEGCSVCFKHVIDKSHWECFQCHQTTSLEDLLSFSLRGQQNRSLFTWCYHIAQAYSSQILLLLQCPSSAQHTQPPSIFATCEECFQEGCVVTPISHGHSLGISSECHRVYCMHCQHPLEDADSIVPTVIPDIHVPSSEQFLSNDTTKDTTKDSTVFYTNILTTLRQLDCLLQEAHFTPFSQCYELHQTMRDQYNPQKPMQMFYHLFATHYFYNLQEKLYNSLQVHLHDMIVILWRSIFESSLVHQDKAKTYFGGLHLHYDNLYTQYTDIGFHLGYLSSNFVYYAKPITL